MAFQDMIPGRERRVATRPPFAAAQRLMGSLAALSTGPRANASTRELLASLLRIQNRTRKIVEPRVHVRMSVYRPDGRSAAYIIMSRQKG